MSTSDNDEPTFTIGEFAEAFGYMCATPENGTGVIEFARNALDDARRTLRIAEEMMVGDDDYHPLMEVVSNAAKRAEVADDMIARLLGYPRRPARPVGEATAAE